MALKNYRLYAPSTVIQVDDRNPWTSWENHLARTQRQRGGVDIVAAVGTPVIAPTDGVWNHQPNNGGAGNSGEFAHDANPGWRDVFSHLTSYVGKSGKWFRQGEVIAYSGNTGGVTQHLHRHLLTPKGVRVNPWDYFTPINANPVASRPTPTLTPEQIEEAELMAAKEDIINALKDHINSRFNDLAAVVTREGTDSRVFFNEASGIYAVGGLGYWWELGSDINKESIPATWQARKKFGEDTLESFYRKRGLAQRETHSCASDEWDFIRMLCLNNPATPEAKKLQEIENRLIALDEKIK